MQRIQIGRELLSSRLCFFDGISENFSPRFGLTTSFTHWNEIMVRADSRSHSTIVGGKIAKRFSPSLVPQWHPDSGRPRKRNQRSVLLPAVFWCRTERSFYVATLRDPLRKRSHNLWLFCIHLPRDYCSWTGRAPRCSPSAPGGKNGKGSRWYSSTIWSEWFQKVAHRLSRFVNQYGGSYDSGFAETRK